MWLARVVDRFGAGQETLKRTPNSEEQGKGVMKKKSLRTWNEVLAVLFRLMDGELASFRREPV